MIHELIASPALWGFAGAISYAAPLLSTCLFTSSQEPGGSSAKCTLDFIIAVFIGTVAAAAFTPLIQELLHKSTDPWLRVIAVTIGLLANRIAPKLVDTAPDALLNWTRRMFEARTK